ncbi:MAG TPA: class I SAM-dependent methyltransferase [Candidatus Scybalocola faecavium]|nr:class I SAM-dependent methyltransferase [Candidatus Scybalocola faecavium]
MEALKQRMTDYWSQRVESFSALRLKELEGNKHLLWLDEMKKYIPMDRKLKILDVGTGTGFFAFLLADQGHDVTGIDLTPDMIREAQRMSKALGIPADFYVMDAEMPDFPPGSFDVIVSRNLTWALPHMDRAYQAWRRLLKKDGVLINFDGDYCREKEPRVLPAHHAHTDIAPDLMDEYEHLKEELKDSQQPRPQWDRQLLARAGFSRIHVDTSVWFHIYGEMDEFYNPTPIFTIAAYV